MPSICLLQMYRNTVKLFILTLYFIFLLDLVVVVALWIFLDAPQNNHFIEIKGHLTKCFLNIHIFCFFPLFCFKTVSYSAPTLPPFPQYSHHFPNILIQALKLFILKNAHIFLSPQVSHSLIYNQLALWSIHVDDA